MAARSFLTRAPEETIALGERLGRLLHPGDCIALTGPLAAGKTVFAKGIARALGVTETVTSPTFTILSEYEGRIPFYHFDAWRLSGADDFADLGADAQLCGSGVSAVEWSERIERELPPSAVRVAIALEDGDNRAITITFPPGDPRAL